MDLRFRVSNLLVIVSTVITVLGGMGHARAEMPQKLEARLNAAVEKLQVACGEDLKKYCSMVTPGEGRMLLCMEAHEDKITNKCDYALFGALHNLEHALDRIEEAADACWNDIEKYCASVPEGSGHIAQCLVSKKADLSAACKTVIGKFEAAK
jgi:Cysteine rich repeat